jgi:hypothetical protein
MRVRPTGVSSAVFLAAVVLAIGTLALAGCASVGPEPESERLDTTTGTTLTLMPRPIELVAEQARASRNDPFAYLAPFQTNRMGSHELFLWVSAPQVGSPLGVPKVFCGDSAVALQRFEGTTRDMGLSSEPYRMPAPWNVQWYFRLSGEELDCLASTPRLRVITETAEGERDTFTAEGPALSALGTFTAKVRT